MKADVTIDSTLYKVTELFDGDINEGIFPSESMF